MSSAGPLSDGRHRQAPRFGLEPTRRARPARPARVAAAGCTVLFVCTANHCRSPVAESLFAALPEFAALDWHARSAGTHARAGEEMHPHAAAVLSARGIDASGWRSQPLTATLIDGADLVLAASREHRRVVARIAPRAVPRTFLLQQFARYVANIDSARHVDSLPTLIEQACAVRAGMQPVPDGHDDLPDPMGQPLPAFEQLARRVERDLATIAGALAAPSRQATA